MNLGGAHPWRMYGDRQGFTLSQRVNLPLVGGIWCLGRSCRAYCLPWQPISRTVGAARASGQRSVSALDVPALGGAGCELIGIAWLVLLCRPARAAVSRWR